MKPNRLRVPVGIPSYLRHRGPSRWLTGLGLALGLLAPHAVRSADWSPLVTAALERAGTNRQELVSALEHVPAAQAAGLDFLITNMPPGDLRTLSSKFLLGNLDQAYRSFAAAPWAAQVPPAIFLNDVLPYASLSEQRDDWRQKLHDLSLPLMAGAKTPGEAGSQINAQLFKLTKVKYSTKRRAPDQGPFETMETGVATCTGLSILLVDACRSVGVPARIAGTPLWANNSGNHTWVEIWDGGAWHFTGAAEQSAEGLDRGWFVGNASQATLDDPRHAIYATSFQRTGMAFPMTWARDEVDDAPAVNVTARYAAKAKAPAPPEQTVLKVRVFNRPVGERVVAKVTVTDAADAKIRFTGESKPDTADMNDHLAFPLPKRHTFLIEAEKDGHSVKLHYTTLTNAEDVLNLFLSGIPPLPEFHLPVYVPPAVTQALATADDVRLQKAFTDYFLAAPEARSNFVFAADLEALLAGNEPAVRRAAWTAYRGADRLHTAQHEDFAAHQVRFESHVSPYTVKTVGTRPAAGWPIFIAMHGGGGAPQELNDSQWRHMQIYYRDHPELGGYLYVALRAPDNTWNGFYTGYAYPLIDNLLRQFLLFADTDPNKQFIMGYSHGGYGAYAIGPKIPDHFAAIHASAAALADGAVALTLRNTYFSTMVGAKDTAYGRSERVKDFQRDIDALRGGRDDIYPVTIQVIAEHPHSGLPDRDKIPDMYSKIRNPVPRELNWRLTDKVNHDFFWLHVDEAVSGEQIDAACRDNRLTVKTTANLAGATLLLDRRLIDFAQPVTVEHNGRTSTRKLQPSLRTLAATLLRRGDPELAFTAELTLP